jgi:hypothetical protein
MVCVGAHEFDDVHLPGAVADLSALPVLGNQHGPS